MATQQGIWKPRQLQAALSFRTVFASDPSQRPYDDEAGPDGFLRYKWRGTDPDHPDNRALRRAMVGNLPLIWFQGVASALYYPIYPVWLAEEEPARARNLSCLWMSEEALRLRHDLELEDPELVRSYAERVVKARLHQPLFRQRVLLAYQNQCSICRLRHTRLLDAAHVLADAEGGQPVVTNGIAMCKIHHAAYDADIFGINPNYQGWRPSRRHEGARRAHPSVHAARDRRFRRSSYPLVGPHTRTRSSLRFAGSDFKKPADPVPQNPKCVISDGAWSLASTQSLAHNTAPRAAVHMNTRCDRDPDYRLRLAKSTSVSANCLNRCA